MRLRIQVVTSSATPLYKQVVDQVRAAIARGDLEVGAPLPSVRALAEELRINMNTVAKAYTELAHHGDVVSEPGRGVFAAARAPSLTLAERRRRLAEAVERIVAEAVHLGVDRDDLVAAIVSHCERTGLLVDSKPAARAPHAKERRHG